MKKPGLTIDDHKAAGLALKQILESLLNLKVTLNNCYSEKKFPARLLSRGNCKWYTKRPRGGEYINLKKERRK